MKSPDQKRIQQVWDHFLQYHDDVSRNILLEHYLDLVKYTAQRLSTRFPKSIDLADLYSAGILGLIDAISKFNPSRNIKFETYCVRRIKGAILDDIRRNDQLSRLVRARAQQLQKVNQQLQTLYGRMPTDEELAAALGLNKKAFYELLRDANAGCLISLNAGFSSAEGDETFGELSIYANQKSQDPFLEIQKRDLREFLFKGFSSEERIILKLYYLEEMTMKEIGKTLGISESRVCQIHSSVIARLRARFNQYMQVFTV
ncbi:MAG TPA: FliA/WhiG family RNA polymerase sigma factor [Anaerohalosphaeraceae bacterium]|nr:FliA/WhiG family RNA polymerase sigma factor [Phycisphaerae bacterium]HOK96083.1 FliA/WhiG family RNA polymerase sigma factor [Anaerohalosphaeraceae bacterium]HOL30965.1 FliA/WhiG family RNA polymerase sigma factor [Anaerohalosphaeraceae bacterium]HOM75343.1 FliA/WhiG family RNA polymerase sigma factor [Anaerohalosphaeraceae bacterium]HPC63331.1 FliA/WhiG family RNA polymerase sigma factor [Anaerohalosphaeraceae bacterium]